MHVLREIINHGTDSSGSELIRLTASGMVAVFLAVQSLSAQPVVQQSFPSTALSVGFVENQGQVVDQYQKATTEVEYIYSNGLFNLQLKKNGFSYELFQLAEKHNGKRSAKKFEYDPYRQTGDEENEFEFHSSRVDVNFMGASAPVLLPSDATGAVLNYYTVNSGSDGITGVQSYFQITYQDVYPGIDLCFFAPDSENASLKYEWKVNPGADASKIRMQYSGALSLAAVMDGSVEVTTPKGKINEGKIVAYTVEDHKDATVSYVVERNILSYATAAKSGQTLIIDPNITWFTYYGGTATEDLFEGELAIDGKGSPLLAGNTSSPQYIASTGAYQVTYGEGGVDGFVAKFKQNGQLAWATYYGSYDRDGCHAIAADAAYNIFVGGNTYSNSGIATVGSHQEIFGGSMDAFLVKFNSNGIRQWATYFGGTGYGDQINGVECDASGNVYFTGYTCSPNNISTPGAYQEVYNGVDDVTGDVMVGEFTTNGNLIWASYHSGPGQDRAHDIVLLQNGDFYVEGTCESTSQFSTPGVHQSTYGGGPQDAFIAKWHGDGELVWCSYYGGEKDEHGRGLAIDSGNNAYIGGWTASTTGIGTPGAAQPDWFTGYNNQGVPSPDAYLAKFTPDGALVWGTYYGGKDLERSRGITVDKKKNFIYVVGQTGSKTNVASINIFKPDTGLIEQEGFVSKYSDSGALLYSYLIGGPGKQNVFDADLDKSNTLYLVMTTDQVIYTTASVYQGGPKGGDDVILLKLNPADSCYDKYEPNNSNLAAKTIASSADTLFFGYTGVIADATDTDWFLLKPGLTNLKVELLDLVADYDIFLYKSNMQLIASSAKIGTADESIVYNNIPKGKYYLRISAAGTDFAPNACYRLRSLTSSVPWPLKANDPATIYDQLDMQAFVFPNPVSEILNVKITSPIASDLQATLYDLRGQVVATSTNIIEAGTMEVSMNLEDTPPGLYLLQLEANGKKMLSKIVVQR